MAKTAKTIAPLKTTGFPDGEIITLFMAHNSGAKGVPAAATGRRLYYDGPRLFGDRGDLVLVCVRKGKARFVLATNEGWRGGGWGSLTQKVVESADYQTTGATGPVIRTCVSPGFLLSNADLNLSQAERPLEINAVSLREMVARNADAGHITYLARLYRVPLSAIYAPVAPSLLPYRRDPVERATHYMEWYTPAARAKRAKEKREAEAERQRKWREASRLRPYRSAVFYAQNALSSVVQYDVAITSTDILEFCGYTAQPGDMFKFLSPGFQSNHGPWPPAIGQWTEDRQPVNVCHHGWHLTDVRGLAQWMRWGSELYLAEGAGECSPPSPQNDGKQAFQRARLLRQIGTGVTKKAIQTWKRDQLGGAHREQVAAAAAALAEAEYVLAMAEQGYI